MKKVFTGIAAVLLMTCFSAAGWAYPGREGRQVREFDPGRKAGWVEFVAEKNKLRADFLNGEVAAGRLSRQAADAHITLMDERLAQIKDGGQRRRAESAAEREAARKARRDYFDKVRALEIASIQKAVAAGRIEKEKGERMIERLENDGGYRYGGCRRGGEEGCGGYGRGGGKGYYR
ncbi:MAG: hypothetical protein LBO03_06285 [Acidaminococcales bacterium]|jgi:hypothetical protein|nr:hypothetical protein [Acidaminococcales bacterium]